MSQVYVSNLERDGEVRRFKAHGQAMIGSAGGATYSRAVFEPGWRWSTDIGPLTGTTSCQTRHLGFVISGRMAVRCDDGTETEIGSGDIFDLPAGHDAWVIGDEPAILIDVSPEATRYASPAGAAEDRYIHLVRKGYAAFNSGDVQTLVDLLSHDVAQHVPGTSALAGAYKGRDAVLGYYAKLGEMTGGTFRALLVDAHGDGQGHVTAIHQVVATRNGATRVTRGSILFTFLGDKVTDLLELRADLAGDDAFFG